MATRTELETAELGGGTAGSSVVTLVTMIYLVFY